MTDIESPPSTPTLTPLKSDAQFAAACLIGVPALVIAYIIGVRLGIEAWQGDLDLTDAGGTIAALLGLLTANPITVYLAARQYPRGKAVEAVGTAAVARIETGGQA